MSSSIDRFLQIAIDKKASDIYLISDSEIALKIEGEHVILSDMANQDELMQFINEILPQHVKDAVLSRKEVDDAREFIKEAIDMYEHHFLGKKKQKK